MKRLAVVTTHPIQYYAPVFNLLAQRAQISIKVFYTIGGADSNAYDPGFDKKITWDIPLLEGYAYEWVMNTAAVPGSGHFDGIVNPQIGAQISAWRPDAVLVYGWAYRGHLKAMRHFHNKIPVYFKGDSTLLNNIPGVRSVAKYLLLRWVYSHVDIAFYNGQRNLEYFRYYGLKDHQLAFAPHAVDNDRFSTPRASEAAALRVAMGIRQEDILILYAGKFDTVKNLSLLLDAFCRMGTTNVHLLFAGNGPQEIQLKQQAAQGQMKRYIHFTGFKNQGQMPALYQSADLVCLPSVSETWGLAINEAMACQRAVLVSDRVGCASDLVRPGVNGEIFDSGSLSSLLMKLQELTRSKEVLKAYGEASGRLIKEWNFTNVAIAIERLTLQ